MNGVGQFLQERPGDHSKMKNGGIEIKGSQQGWGLVTSLKLPLNTRAGTPPTPFERTVLSQALTEIQGALRGRDAVLALAATLWALAQGEVHSPPLGVQIRWAQLAALRLGVEMSEVGERLASLLAPLRGGLPGRVGHFIDTLAPGLYPECKEGQAQGRKRSGAYITPYPIARLMAERSLEAFDGWPPLSVLDPGTGTGVFLSAALHVLSSMGLRPGEALGRLFGVEREKALAELARLLLALEAGLDPEEALQGQGPRIFTEDFILPGEGQELEKHAPYSILLMNPPYERISKIDRGDEGTKLSAKLYAECIRRSGLYPLSGRGALDAYRLFMERALRLLAQGGSASFIIPASFLADKSAASLRQHLLARGWLVSVDLYPERARLFEGVTQEIVILTLSTRSNQRIEVLLKGRHVATLPISRVRGLSDTAALLIVNQKGLALYKHLAGHARLGDLQGIMIQRGEIDQTQDRELMGQGKGRFLRGAHVQRFRIIGEDRCDIEALLVRKRGSSKTRHIFLPRLAGRQVANRGSKNRLVFAYVEPPTVLGNSLNYILLEDEPPPHLNLWVLLGLLNSRLLNWFFHVSNSNNHIGTYELEALPIPINAEPEKLSRIGDLAAIATHTGLKRELQEELDRLVVEAFGLDLSDLEGVFPEV